LKGPSRTFFRQKKKVSKKREKEKELGAQKKGHPTQGECGGSGNTPVDYQGVTTELGGPVRNTFVEEARQRGREKG